MKRDNPKGEAKQNGNVSCRVSRCSFCWPFDIFEANAHDKAKAEEQKHWTEYHESTTIEEV